MKAVIYARYSSDDQREESIEGQLREAVRYRPFSRENLGSDIDFCAVPNKNR